MSVSLSGWNSMMGLVYLFECSMPPSMDQQSFWANQCVLEHSVVFCMLSRSYYPVHLVHFSKVKKRVVTV